MGEGHRKYTAEEIRKAGMDEYMQRIMEEGRAMPVPTYKLAWRDYVPFMNGRRSSYSRKYTEGQRRYIPREIVQTGEDEALVVGGPERIRFTAVRGGVAYESEYRIITMHLRKRDGNTYIDYTFGNR